MSEELSRSQYRRIEAQGGNALELALIRIASLESSLREAEAALQGRTVSCVCGGRAAAPAPRAFREGGGGVKHEHDFCIPQWKPMPGTAPGFEQQKYCYDWKCECGRLRFAAPVSAHPDAGKP